MNFNNENRRGDTGCIQNSLPGTPGGLEMGCLCNAANVYQRLIQPTQKTARLISSVHGDCTALKYDLKTLVLWIIKNYIMSHKIIIYKSWL